MNLKSILVVAAFFICGLTYGQAPSITTQVNQSAYCQGDTMRVIFQTSDTFVSDNQFYIQLSDTNGSFADAMVIDSVLGQSGDTLYIPVPNVPADSSYKIRVVGTDPGVIGVASSVFIIKKVLPAPNTNLSLSGTTSFCIGDSTRLTFNPTANLVFKWMFNDSTLPSSIQGSYLVKDSGQYIIKITDTASVGCSVGIDTIVIAVHQYPVKPAIHATGPTNICGVGPITLVSTTHNGYTYQWLENGANINGATTTSYGATESGQYRVVASSFGCTRTSDSINLNIHQNPNVTLNLPTTTFCLNGDPYFLYGGSPGGGYYAGDYVNQISQFVQSLSGVGTFTITYYYSDSIGCHASASQQVTVVDGCTNTAVNEVADAHAFQVYPNPTNGIINIDLTDASPVQMKVSNLLGQQVMGAVINQHTVLSVKQLPAGVYMVEVADLAAKWKSVKRLVIQ